MAVSAAAEAGSQVAAVHRDVVIAAPAASGVGNGVTVGVPILIILILFYMVTHKGHKLSGLILAFVAGVMLAGTQVAASLSELVDKLVTSGVDAITSVFS